MSYLYKVRGPREKNSFIKIFLVFLLDFGKLLEEIRTFNGCREHTKGSQQVYTLKETFKPLYPKIYGLFLCLFLAIY